MLFTYGVGSVVDLPHIAAMVMGIDDWDTTFCQEIAEDRLLLAVQTDVGNQVTGLYSPPIPKETGTYSPNAEPSRIGVPVAPFPRWMVCPFCHLLSPLGTGLIDLKASPYRPDRTAYVHANCPKQGLPLDMIPVRFLIACKNGHLDDFPWTWFLHQGPTTCKGALRLYEQGVSGEARDILIKCDDCGARRRMSAAFGDEGKKNLPPKCRGRRPHLRDYDERECNEPIRSILLGASNSWFPLTLSALSIPSSVDRLSQLVDEHWVTLGKIEAALELGILRRTGMLHPFAEVSDDALWAAIEARRNPAPQAELPDPRDLKTPEWKVFSKPDPDLNTSDFLLKSVGAPRGFEKLFRQVVLVERIREVNALVGFTRIESPDGFSDMELEEGWERRRVALSRRPPTWVPASEVRGEGLFLHFDRPSLDAWLAKPSVKERDRVFLDAHRQWREARHLNPDLYYPGIGYVLIHSFAHALMRQLCLECGYSAASIEERIYWSAGTNDDEGMAGLLIYTAAPDSEGTLGGLVNLGMPSVLGGHISQALEMIDLCASDPLCAEHHPHRDGTTLHGASCHACLFAPETACERSNRYLDRSVLLPTVSRSDLAFFPARER